MESALELRATSIEDEADAATYDVLESFWGHPDES
jgi:hypothetical protein